MSRRDEHHPASVPAADRFVTTHWSLVIAAERRESPESAGALAELCRTYWYPLYAFVRRHQGTIGFTTHEGAGTTFRVEFPPAA